MPRSRSRSSSSNTSRASSRHSKSKKSKKAVKDQETLVATEVIAEIEVQVVIVAGRKVAKNPLGDDLDPEIDQGIDLGGVDILQEVVPDQDLDPNLENNQNLP